MRSGATVAVTRTPGSRASARPAMAASAKGAPTAARAGSPRITASSAPAAATTTALARVGEALALMVLGLHGGRGRNAIEQAPHDRVGVDAPDPQLGPQHQPV